MIDAELQRVEETLKMTQRFLKAEERAVKEAMEYILRQMINYAKSQAGGNYQDRTANLRNSLSINIKDMRTYDKDTSPQLLQSKIRELENPVIEIKGDDYQGAISAGMEYAIFVELKSGYTVLQGSVDRFEPLIEKYLGDYLRVDKVRVMQ